MVHFIFCVMLFPAKRFDWPVSGDACHGYRSEVEHMEGLWTILGPILTIILALLSKNVYSLAFLRHLLLLPWPSTGQIFSIIL